jgi:spore germination protein GerM
MIVFIMLLGGASPLSGDDDLTRSISEDVRVDSLTDTIAGEGLLDTGRAHIYFADRFNQYLIAEERTFDSVNDPITLGKQIVEAMILGPQSNLMRTIPRETTVRALYLTADRTAYIDFSQAITDSHPGGVNCELLTLYSIVNALVLNIQEIDRVKILIEGDETDTLAGHIDIQKPLHANMLLVR